jgi:hypothetical protein
MRLSGSNTLVIPRFYAMSWTQQLAAWWIDFFAAATVLLIVVLVAGWIIRQPVQRMAMAWSAMIALAVLAVCCAAPGWPRVAIFVKKATVEQPLLTPPPPMQPIESPQRPPEMMGWMGIGMHDIHNAATEAAAKKETSAASIPPIATESIAPKPFDDSLLFATALLAGPLTVSAWLLLGQFRAARIRRRATPAPEFAQQELQSIVGPQARLPKLLVDKLLSTAAAMGLWRPTILLPTQAVAVGQTFLSAETGWLLADKNVCPTTNDSKLATGPSLRALLAHEWAHIERGDLWLLALGRLLLIVLFAHPLYWLLRRRIRADQELLADALAAAHCGRHEYAETLLAWARHQPQHGSRMNWALGIW